MSLDDNLNLDDIDFNKQKRGKGKNKASTKGWSFFVVEGIIVLVAMIVGGRFLFTNSEISHLQATIDAQQSQIPTSEANIFDRATENAQNPRSTATLTPQQNDRPSLSAEDLYNRAINEAENGLTQDAIRSFNLAIELDPSYAQAYFERGQLHYQLDQYYSAANDYKLALEYNYEDRAIANFNLGMAHFEDSNYPQAIRALSTVIELDENDASAYYWRGRSNVEIYNYSDGIEDMIYGIEMGYEDQIYPYFWLAKAYADYEDYDSAIRYYSISLRNSLDNCLQYECWIDYNNRGVSYYWLEDYESAIKDYTSAIQVNPEPYPLAFQNRGNAYEVLENLTLALSDWNTMFLLLEDKPVTRSLNTDTQVLRATLERNHSQIHVEFEGNLDDKVTISLTVPEGSNLDAMLLLRDMNDTALAYSAFGDSQDAELTDVVLSATGTYTIVVASDLGESLGEFTLRLE